MRRSLSLRILTLTLCSLMWQNTSIWAATPNFSDYITTLEKDLTRLEERVNTFDCDTYRGFPSHIESLRGSIATHSETHQFVFWHKDKPLTADFGTRMNAVAQKINQLGNRLDQVEAECAEEDAQEPPTSPGSDQTAGIRDGSIIFWEPDNCQFKQPGPPNDPLYKKRDSWGIKKIGFTANRKSAWNIEDGSSNPVIVAVIDSGLDWNHKDFDRNNIWQNPGEIPGNGKDDDNNGFVDDIIGWNFVANNNKPWDDDGHGTFVTGIIAAKTNNKVGIAGINQHAKIMVLKALNVFGQTRSSLIAEAIFYAARHGAKVINISVGGKGVTRTQQDAINYAHKMGALVVMAAGNEAVDTNNYSSGLHHVITVAATDAKDRRIGFSNWGQQVDIAAPGRDIVSLRARRTDLMASVQGIKYKIGDNYVGKDKRYFRASGTSFSAPMVAATASLIWAHNPKLTNDQVKNMLLNSTKDIESPGWDNLTGYGLMDATAALKADPDYLSIAKISQLKMANKNGAMMIEVYGSASSSDFKNMSLEIGYGKKPRKWKKLSIPKQKSIKNGLISSFPVANTITKRGTWMVRLILSSNKHGQQETRKVLTIN